MSNKNRGNQQQQRPTGGNAGPKPEAQTPPVEDQQQQQQQEGQQDQSTDAEQTGNLEQGAGGEQIDTNKATESAQPTAAPVVESKSAEAAKPTAQAKAIETQSEKGFKPVYKVELELTGYAEAMDPKKPMVPEVGGKWQYSLFKAIKSCFSAASQEIFNAEFGTVVNFFHKNKDGFFNEKFIFRFPEQWPGSSNEYTQNRRLIFMIIQTADPKTRKKSLEGINMELVAEGMAEAHKQMLFNFYHM